MTGGGCRRYGRSLGVLALLAAALARPAVADAHRLDEVLQTTRLAIDPATIDVEVALSPGIEVAAVVIAAIDNDGDGAFSVGEVDAFARDALRAMTLAVDGTVLPWRLVRRELPPIDEIREGVGTIRLVATAAAPPAAGGHALTFVNAFAPAASVYQVNALAPRDARIRLGSPQRDPRQQTFALDYAVAAAPAGRVWVALATLLLAGLVVGRLAARRR